MGNILNPGNRNSFAKLVRKKSENLFVDKTDFIGHTIEWIDQSRMFIAMTRPRRFGKTVMAHMLAAYYSCGCDSRELFEGLKITRYNPKKQQLSSVELGGCGTADFHSGSEKVKETEPKPVTEVQIDANTVSDGENIKCENADSNKEYRATDNTEREAEDRADRAYA